MTWGLVALALAAGFVLGAAVTAFCLYDLVLRIEDARDEGLRF